MNPIPSTPINRNLQLSLLDFIDSYGESALQEAMQLYVDKHQEYICKTKSGISRIKIRDIYYLNIQRHKITIYTSYGTYNKYGTLSGELSYLSQFGFIKCNQSCLVALDKIKTIQRNSIILIDNTTKLHISRTYIPKVLAAFSGMSNM